MERKTLHAVGTPVPKCGVYTCDTCEDVLGIEVKEVLKEGEYFPKCSSCENISIWKRFSSRN